MPDKIPNIDEPYNKDDPIHNATLSLLQFLQNVYDHLSPMDHIIALAFAQTHIANAIDTEAKNLVAQEISNDFMGRAANMAGFSAPASAQPIMWNPQSFSTPDCPNCTDAAYPIIVHNLIMDDGTADGLCSKCNSKFKITLTGGKI